MKNCKLLRLAAILCSVICILAMIPTGASALAPIDTTRDSSLTVKFCPDGHVASNTKFSVYKIADVSPSCAFTLTSEYAGYPISISHLNTAGWRALAQTLAGFVAVDHHAAMVEDTTNASGIVSFTHITPSLYLVIGQNYVDGNYTYSPSPFLVCVPTYNTSYVWQYDMQVEPKYDSTYNPTGLTVTRKVLKTWKNDDPATRPDHVSVTLLENGVPYETVDLTAADSWRHTWNNLKSSSTWQIVENPVPANYNVTVEKEGITFLVTNTSNLTPPPPEPPKTSRTVEKKWENDSGKPRPGVINVALLKDGTEIGAATLSVVNDWKYTWTDLEIGPAYRIVEKTELPSYATTSVTNGTVTTLTNTWIKPDDPSDPIPTTVSRTVKKEWVGDVPADRPAGIQVALLKNGAVQDTVTLTEAGGWEYTWTGLDATASWEVREQTILEHYESSAYYADGKFIITNTLKDPIHPPVPKTPLTVKKSWEDESPSKRPSSVSVSLLKDGAVEDTVTLSSANAWQYTWTELDADKNWSVKENEIPYNYTASVVQNGTIFTIVNSYHTPPTPHPDPTPVTPFVPTTVSRTVTKSWVGDSADRRPSSISVSLLMDGSTYATAELSASNGWSYTWNDLAATATWEIRELSVPTDYIATSAFSASTFNLTNTLKKEEEDPSEDDNKKDTTGQTIDEDTPATPTDADVPGETMDDGGNGSGEQGMPNIPNPPEGGIIDGGSTEVPTPPTVPDSEKLPQTGMLQWPIPVLALLGVALFLIGRIKQKADGEKRDA